MWGRTEAAAAWSLRLCVAGRGAGAAAAFGAACAPMPRKSLQRVHLLSHAEAHNIFWALVGTNLLLPLPTIHSRMEQHKFPLRCRDALTVQAATGRYSSDGLCDERRWQSLLCSFMRCSSARCRRRDGPLVVLAGGQWLTPAAAVCIDTHTSKPLAPKRHRRYHYRFAQGHMAPAAPVI